MRIEFLMSVYITRMRFSKRPRVTEDNSRRRTFYIELVSIFMISQYTEIHTFIQNFKIVMVTKWNSKSLQIPCGLNVTTG
jgi:hypothetical protein